MMTTLNNRMIHVFESKDELSKGIGDYVAQIGTATSIPIALAEAQSHSLDSDKSDQ